MLWLSEYKHEFVSEGGNPGGVTISAFRINSPHLARKLLAYIHISGFFLNGRNLSWETGQFAPTTRQALF